jgi:hypothetical protein
MHETARHESGLWIFDPVSSRAAERKQETNAASLSGDEANWEIRPDVGCAAPASAQSNGQADACWPAHGSHLRFFNKRIVDTEFLIEGGEHPSRPTHPSGQ